eukprot:g33505.t1
MQKPFVHTWHYDGLDDEDIFDAAVVQNRRSALAAALLSVARDHLDVRSLLASVVGLSYSEAVRQKALQAGSQEPGLPLRRTLQATVRQASMQQAVKGVLSSGVTRSLRYVLQKVPFGTSAPWKHRLTEDDAPTPSALEVTQRCSWHVGVEKIFALRRAGFNFGTLAISIAAPTLRTLFRMHRSIALNAEVRPC